MSRYLQRLAQRSGLTVGASARAASTGPMSAAASPSRSTSPDDDSPAGTGMDGVEVIDQLREVSQPISPPEAGSSTQASTATTQKTAGGQYRSDQVESSVTVHPLHRDRAASAVSSHPIEETEPVDSIGKGTKGRELSAGHAQDDSKRGQYRALLDDERRSFDSSFGSSAATGDAGAGEPALSVTQTKDSTLPAATGERPADLKPPAAPQSLVDQAIQWVMDDPYWTKQTDDSAVDPSREKQDTDSQLNGLASVRIATKLPARVPPRDNSAIGTSPTRAAESSSDVQVHIGRVAIEIHQPEGPAMVPQAPSARNKPGTPRRSEGSSDSRLRRLYLRGF